jgi:cell division protein FtsI (penicillin-binding protein 3)
MGSGKTRLKRKRTGPNLRLRMGVVAGFAILALLITSVRLVSIQGMDSMKLAEKALESRLVTRTLPADRGQILASDGTVLADSVSRYQLVVDQQNVAQYKVDGELVGAWGAAEALAKPLNTDPGLIYPKLVGDKRWNPVAKGLTSETWRKVKKLDVLGVSAEEYSVRSYPAGGVAGNLVGFLSSDGTAQAGLEMSYDKELSGTDGQQQYERGARGEIIPLGDNNIKDAVDGEGLQTTIDPDIQYYAQQAIEEQRKKHKAESGSIVIKEVKTGRIIAAADAPTVDPNSPGKVDGVDRGSRIFTDVYEPGSTAKMVTAAALLDQGLVTPTTEFTVPDKWKAPNDEEFRDSRREADLRGHPRPVLEHGNDPGRTEAERGTAVQLHEEVRLRLHLGDRIPR